MEIKLSKRLARNSPADEFDVRQLKKALNRLGYYQPLATTGVTGIPDTALFNALKSFQQDQGLTPDGVASPGSITLQKLNAETSKEPAGQYIWRTAGDSRVRESHATLNALLRHWSDTPDPGEDFNCRCWAAPLNCEQDFIIQHITNIEPDAPNQWEWWEYLHHFWNGQGSSVSLQSIGWLGPVADECNKTIFPKVEQQLKKIAAQMGPGNLRYHTKNSYEFQNVSFSLGGAVIESQTKGTVSTNGQCLIIEADIDYAFSDDFTDITSIREKYMKLQNRIPAAIPEWLKLELERGDWTDFDGKPYYIHGSWKTKLAGIIKNTRAYK